MKRRFALKSVLLILLAVFTTVVTSCGGKPSTISDEHYQYGKKAIEIIDSYLDYDIDADAAHQQLEKLTERKGTLPQTEFDDPTHSSGSTVEIYVDLAEYRMSKMYHNPSKADLNDLIEYRNNIADETGDRHR